MADAKTITLKRYDALWDVQTRLDYTHAMIGLLIEQKDYPKLPPHQQVALQALVSFADESRKELNSILSEGVA